MCISYYRAVFFKVNTGFLSLYSSITCRFSGVSMGLTRLEDHTDR